MNLDLVVLAADKSIEEALRGLLSRQEAVRIRALRCELIRHPEKDPGCFHNPEEYLRPYLDDARHALVVFDRAWEGVPEGTVQSLESTVEDRLRSSWEDRARVVVIDPELEVWVWSNSPVVDQVLGWKDRHPPLREWVQKQGWWREGHVKPLAPKDGYEAALREVRKPKSSSNFRSLAERVSIGRCIDPSFLRLLEILRGWFPRQGMS